MKLTELRCLNPVNSHVVKVTVLLTLFSECQSETVFVVSESREVGVSLASDGSFCSDILLQTVGEHTGACHLRAAICKEEHGSLLQVETARNT